MVVKPKPELVGVCQMLNIDVQVLILQPRA